MLSDHSCKGLKDCACMKEEDSTPIANSAHLTKLTEMKLYRAYKIKAAHGMQCYTRSLYWLLCCLRGAYAHSFKVITQLILIVLLYNVWGVERCWLYNYHYCSLIPRPFPPPVFDCLQYDIRGRPGRSGHVR